MILKDVISQLEQKWGPFADAENSICNGNLEYMKSGLKFNYIFKPISKDKYFEYAANNDITIPDELLSVYGECNGFRLFLSSLSIYGIQERKSEMEPYDLGVENSNSHSRLKGKYPNQLIFGAFGRDYLLAYDLTEDNKITCISIEDGYVIKTFCSLVELLDFFVPRMIKLYDFECRKIKPDKIFKGIPALENATFDFKELIYK